MANTAMRAWSRPRWLKVYVFYIDSKQDGFIPFKNHGEAMASFHSLTMRDTDNLKRVELRMADGYITHSWTNPKHA